MIARILSSIARWMIANQSHPKKRFGVYMFIICLAALATAVLFHFSLTVYYAFSLAVLILTIAFLYRYDIPERTVVDETKAICLFSLVTITVLSVITFETYCNAKGGVFANIDHHALSLKGFALADKGMATTKRLLWKTRCRGTSFHMNLKETVRARSLPFILNRTTLDVHFSLKRKERI